VRSDQVVERAGDGLQRLSEKAAARGGVTAKLAQPLAEDAVFVRKLKPSLIRARMRGELPVDGKPAPVQAPAPAQRPARSGGPNPFAVIGAAAGAGLAVAKLIDWRGHAHPRP